MINKKVFFFGYKSTRWDGYKCTRVLYTTGYFCTRSYISAPDPADFRPDPDPDPSRRHPGDVRPDPDPRPSRIRILDWARSGSGQIRSWSGFWMMMILSRIRIRWDSLQVTIKRTWIRIIDRNNGKRTGSGSFIGSGSGSGSGFRVVLLGIRICSGGLRITVGVVRIRILSKIDRIQSYGVLTCFFIYTGY